VPNRILGRIAIVYPERLAQPLAMLCVKWRQEGKTRIGKVPNRILGRIAIVYPERLARPPAMLCIKWR
jgi:hypothetical protein